MSATEKRGSDSRVQGVIDRARLFLDHEQWNVDVGRLPTAQRVGVRLSRLLSLAWHGLFQNDCLTRASALTYITVLSLVPLMAFAFSMAKGFGAYERLVDTTITPFLDQMAPPIDPSAPDGGTGAQQIRDVVENLLNLVGNTSFANLGTLGLIFLIVAALRLMTTIEGVFNMIWGVRRARPVIRKFTDFVALLAVTPILLLAATTVTVSLQSNAVTEFLTTSLGLGILVRLVTRLVPLMMVWLGFAFLYMVMPNTRVPIVSALVGGVVGGTIWQIVQVLHIQFQIGVANYNAIYAGFAALPLFLVWVYMNWVAVLLGGLVAWAHQTQPAYREQRRAQVTTPADRETLALRALTAIGTSFAAGQGPVSTFEVASQCGVSSETLEDVLDSLGRAGLVASTDDGGIRGFLPARPLIEIRVDQIIRALRGERHVTSEEQDVASDVLTRLDAVVSASPDNLSVQELVGRRAS